PVAAELSPPSLHDALPIYPYSLHHEATMTACIVGWAHTAFGRLEGETVESLIVRVATEALGDAGVAPADVDEIVLGHFNAGFSADRKSTRLNSSHLGISYA